MRVFRLLGIVAPCVGMLGRTLLAQQAASVRPLGPVTATSTEALGNGSLVRVLANGRVLVNDVGKRRLIILDSSLQHSVVVADTTAATAQAYGKGLIGLTPFAADSSLTIDLITGAFLVIDPTGKIARIMRVPGSATPNFGFAGVPVYFDQAGHLLFRAPSPIYLALLDPGFLGDTLMAWPDSNAILRQDLTSGRLDTLVMYQGPRGRQAVSRPRPGSGSGRAAFNPLPAGDDWTVLNDGTVAIVRVHDYRVDRVGPDRKLTTGPRIPITVVPISDSMKVAIMDSIRARDTAMGGGGPPRAYVLASDLPNYRPAFTAGFTRADADGDVWVRSATGTTPPGVVYDVINRSGVLADRVRIPASYTLVGFGPGIAYLTSTNPAGMTIVRARIH